MTKPLLDLSSPLYLKRLARELNGLSDGFYCGGSRYHRAHLRKGQLEARRPVAYIDPHNPRYLSGPAYRWVTVDATTLSDCYGRTVCASRAPR